MPANCRARLQCCLNRSGWNQANWGHIVFRDESHFHLCPDDHRRHVWRRPGQRADPAFTIAHHTDPQQGVMVWGALSFEAGPLWSSLEAHLQHIGTSTAF
ncbi:transposable element Tc1 transposase [Trichonephila clavipes]|nr:transposable element Tc1 transposase [Trichonephila clavipes]